MFSSYSSRNRIFDVFLSFRGEDVRKTFLSHLLKELDRRLVSAFKDNEIERSQWLDLALKQAIRNSRIAIVVFSKHYASSSWCLNELLDIVKCKDEFGQLVIPIFYGLDPSHIRYQRGDFGELFQKTCENKTEDDIRLSQHALTYIANLVGFHSQTWDDEAKMIEEIASDVVCKLNLTPSRDCKDYVGIEDHIAKFSLLLHLESEEVRIVGIWGTSGIGKTTIARVLYNRLSRHFQGSIFIDKAFISKSMKYYSTSNADDYNMKLHLQENFLSKILGTKGIQIDHLGVVEDRLKSKKVLIFIDDLDNQVVLDTLVGQNHWFGYGSRIIVITKDKHFLRAHGIVHIYEVCLPSKELALEILCRFAFKKSYPPEGLMELASEVASCAGNLPLGLNVLGYYLRGKDKDDLIKIEKTLKVSYDGLNNSKDKAIFRYISCLFNGEKVSSIKQLLEDSDLGINIGFNNLVDKSLIHVKEDTVEMHHLLQEMGKLIVRTQSVEPGEREILMDSKDICHVLNNNTGTKNILGISLNIDEMDELHIAENSFKEMCNLLFLKIYTRQKKEVRWNSPNGFDYLPPKLRLLRLDGYSVKHMPSNFCPENFVKLQMQESRLEKLWDGVYSLVGLKNLDMWGSEKLKEILAFVRVWLISFPDISANILELDLDGTAIKNFPSNLRLEKLVHLSMCRMKSEQLWKRVRPLTLLVNMLSPSLTMLCLSNIPSLVELPSSVLYLNKLTHLRITQCINLETIPTGINLLHLYCLDLSGSLRLASFPDISTNISQLFLCETAIEEVPWWIEKFSHLCCLRMNGCNHLRSVSLNISKLRYLEIIDFSYCRSLVRPSWNDCPSVVATTRHNIHPKLLEEASTSLPDDFV
uniref:TIR domain-containing protein n=1 Tax=Brassica oleracea var. oleracea TaxID=109376 RepID=A0A0D3ALW4_BRAOL